MAHDTDPSPPPTTPTSEQDLLNLTPRTKQLLLQQVAAATHALRESSVRMEGKLDALLRLATANAQQLMVVTQAIDGIRVRLDTFEDRLGGFRDGLRNANDRLRAVEGNGK